MEIKDLCHYHCLSRAVDAVVEMWVGLGCVVLERCLECLCPGGVYSLYSIREFAVSAAEMSFVEIHDGFTYFSCGDLFWLLMLRMDVYIRVMASLRTDCLWSYFVKWYRCDVPWRDILSVPGSDTHGAYW